MQSELELELICSGLEASNQEHLEHQRKIFLNNQTQLENEIKQIINTCFEPVCGME